MAIAITKKTSTTETLDALDGLLDKVLALAEGATPENKIEVTVELDRGSYTLDAPLVFSAEENPALQNIRLTIKAKPSMYPTVCPLKSISGADFTPVEGTPYYKYQLEKNEAGEYPKFYDVFCGTKRMKMARSPMWRNPFPLLPAQRSGEEKVEGLYAPIDIVEKVAGKDVGATQLRIYVQWQHYILRVKEVDLSVTAEVKGETYALVRFYEEFDEQFVKGVHEANNIGNRETFLVNNLAYLTEPNTFVYDWFTGTIYVVPSDPEKMARMRFGYTTLANAFIFKGMKDVTVEGIAFAGFTSPYVCDTGYFGTLANREFRAGKLRHAPIVASDTRGFTVKGCSFLDLGGNGVMLCDHTVSATVRDCRFVNVAMCGISVGNYRVGVGGWSDPQNQNYNVKIVNNYLENIAYDYPSSPAIFLCFCDVGEISHNTIKGCAYSGIAAGDGYSQVDFEPGEKVNLRNVEIAYNDVRDFMDVCRDGAAIYVTGANCTKDYAVRFNSVHDNIALLTDIGHRDRRGYYFDGSASNWDVYDNVIDNCAMPLFTQYHVPSQYTHHVHTRNFYSTTDIEPSGNHKPNQDNILGFYAVEESLDALYEKYPAAKAIADAAGYREVVLTVD